MKKKDLVKILKRNKFSGGFTLTELIIASFISVIVIGAAGFGLMAMLRGNNTATIEADKRTEINRALEFISDEIRRAETIDINPTDAFNKAKNDTDYTYDFDPEDSGATDKDNAQPILALNIPNVEAPVLYYISPPESNAWQGPRVIYRLGPSYDNSGNYTNEDDPTKWDVEPLVDRIDDDSSGSLSASCPSGFTASIGAAIQGFYACVEDTGKTAQIFVVGQLENGDTYKADTNVYARATAEDLTGDNPDQNYNPYNYNPSSPPPGDTSTITVKTQVLGSLMGCNPAGVKCDIATEFKVTNNGTETSIHTIAAGDTSETSFTMQKNLPLNIVATPTPPLDKFPPTEQNNQNPISSLNDRNQTVILRDGDDFPNFSAWNAQGKNDFKSLRELLEPQAYIVNDKINLEPNQFIVVFEIGQSYNPDTDDQHPGYDMQDHVLLLTIE